MKKMKLHLKTTINTIWSLLKILIYKSFLVKYNIPKINGNKVFIIGNGPSLKNNLENDIVLLKNSETFCVNTFCLSDYFDIIKPKFYVFLDPAYFRKKNTIKKFIELQNNILKKLNTSVNWNMKLFIPSETDMKEEFDQLCKSNSYINVIYFNNISVHGFNKVCHFLYKKNLAMPEPHNVLVGAIYLSINMGYKNIYLLGADHSWAQDLKVNEKNQVYIADKHFYSIEEVLVIESDGRFSNIGEVFLSLSKAFNTYISLENYASYKASNIYNLTKGSFIDAFERMDINELYK